MGWEWLTMDEIAGRLVAAAVVGFLLAAAGRMLRAANDIR